MRNVIRPAAVNTIRPFGAVPKVAARSPVSVKVASTDTSRQLPTNATRSACKSAAMINLLYRSNKPRQPVQIIAAHETLAMQAAPHGRTTEFPSPCLHAPGTPPDPCSEDGRNRRHDRK